MAINLPSPIQYEWLRPNQPLPEPYFYQYVVARNGLFKRATNEHLSACIPLESFRSPVVGLSDLDEPLLSLNCTPIPATLLRRVIYTARQASTSGFVETFYHFHWQDNQWRVHKPPQSSSLASVRYSLEGYPLDYMNSVVLELHTHPGRAFFSATDNADEQDFRLYGVLGHLDDEQPELLIRLGLYGDHRLLSIDQLFESNTSALVTQRSPQEITSHDLTQ